MNLKIPSPRRTLNRGRRTCAHARGRHAIPIVRLNTDDLHLPFNRPHYYSFRMRLIDLTWIRFNYRTVDYRCTLTIILVNSIQLSFLSHSRISTRLRGVQFDNGSNENCLDSNVIGRNGRNWRRTFFPQISRILVLYIIETTSRVVK